MDDAEKAESLAEQARHYRELQRYLLEQLPYVPLWFEDYVFAAREDLVGYRLAQDGNYDGLIEARRESARR
jgi:peptide/nickel transport system substrate-binding protein